MVMWLLIIAGALGLSAFFILMFRVLYPNHRRVATALSMLSFLPLGLSVLEHRRLVADGVHQVEGALHGHVPHVVALVALLLVGYLVRVVFPDAPSPAAGMSEEELEARLHQDLDLLRYLMDRLAFASEAIIHSELIADPDAAPTAEEDQALRTLWANYVEASVEIDALKLEHRGFQRIPWKTKPHAEAFLIAFGAFVAQYRAELEVTAAVRGNNRVITTFNDPNPRADLPEDSYSAIQARQMAPENLVKLNAGRAYLKLVKGRLDHRPQIVVRVRAMLHDIQDTALNDPMAVVRNPLHAFEKVLLDAWFPIQKGAAVGVSYLRTTNRRYFISHEVAGEVSSRLEPGDIMLERREWHLTNLGIPGYWTHAALYLGTLDTLDAFFADLPELGGASARDYLAERWPEAIAAMAEPGENGFPLAVIEALRPGVVLTSLEASGSCDSLGVLRPRIDRAAKLRAVVDALEHFGKPYDYNFDFTSDDSLVCSELIYKAFHACPDITLEPEMTNGRLLLSPNQMAMKFDAELERDDRQLDFGLFLDGTGIDEVHERTAEELRKAYERPKWHVVFAD